MEFIAEDFFLIRWRDRKEVKDRKVVFYHMFSWSELMRLNDNYSINCWWGHLISHLILQPYTTE